MAVVTKYPLATETPAKDESFNNSWLGHASVRHKREVNQPTNHAVSMTKTALKQYPRNLPCGNTIDE